MSDRNLRRLQRKYLEKSNRKWPERLVQVPREQWEEAERNSPHGVPRLEVWRSRQFLVQLFQESDGVVRMSVVRSEFDLRANRFRDGITWDELQEIKRQIGRAETYAVEVYPRDSDLVAIHNMRHLWLLPEPLPIGWRRDEQRVRQPKN